MMIMLPPPLTEEKQIRHCLTCKGECKSIKRTNRAETIVFFMVIIAAVFIFGIQQSCAPHAYFPNGGGIDSICRTEHDCGPGEVCYINERGEGYCAESVE